MFRHSRTVSNHCPENLLRVFFFKPCGSLLFCKVIFYFQRTLRQDPLKTSMKWTFPRLFLLETDLASHWEGIRLPRASGKFPDFPGSSPNFPGSFSTTSPEVLSLWNLTGIQGFPGSFPDFPGSSPDFPRSFPDFPRLGAR